MENKHTFGELYRYPGRSAWAAITARPHLDVSQLAATVNSVLADVKAHGDEAVKRYEEQFDHVRLDALDVTADEMAEAELLVDCTLKAALEKAAHNIVAFHESQRFVTRRVETCPGVTCWQKSVPIERVGLYIPGGTAPLFSTVLMLAIPARIAGCREIVLCTPPGRDGRVHPAILVAARIAGVSRIFKAGGNQYVMAAKQQVSLHDVAIDMPAGPSEVCVIADGESDAAFVAADLLSQAEHGADSQVVLLVTSETKLIEVFEQLSVQLSQLPRQEIAVKALANSKFVLVHDTDEAMEISNAYAPEHLILATADYERLADKVINAGSVFLGKYACESAGDYASGTNHTLPTHGYAMAYNGVNLDSYHRKVTFQHLTRQGVESIGDAVVAMASNEQLEAHANAMRVRQNDIKG